MKSIKVNGSRILVVAIALAAAVLAYTDAQGSGAAQAIALTGNGAGQERSSRASEVEADLVHADLGDRIEAGLGDAFGGVWFEPATAKYHVGVISPASREIAEAIAVRAGLSEVVAFTPVASTWAQLEATQDSWNRRLEDLFERGQVTTLLRAQHNAVEVELGSSVAPSRRARLDREAADSTVEVSIVATSKSNLRLTPNATRCKKFENSIADCDPTLVAGVTIEPSKTAKTCSAGPAVVRKKPATGDLATETLVLTAGHCINAYGKVGEKWNAFTYLGGGKPGEKKEIGEALAYIYGETDIGVIRINTGFWAKAKDPIPLDPKVAVWNPNAESEPMVVEKAGDPEEGMGPCVSGQTTGTLCGKIVGLNVTGINPDKVELTGLAKVEMGVITEAGDSGGPWHIGSPEAVVTGVHVSSGTKEGKLFGYLQPLSFSLPKLKAASGYDLELLTKDNEKRKHPVFTGKKYPVTVSASNGSSEDEFTAFGSTIKCTENAFHGELTEAKHEEEPAVVEVTPTYKNCTATGTGFPTAVTNNGCKYRFELLEEGEVTEGHFTSEVDIVCPGGQPGIQSHVYLSHSNLTTGSALCTVTLPPQTGLKTVTMTNSAGDIVIDAATIEGVKVKIHRTSFLCPSSGTESETTSGVYHLNEAVTVAGTSGAEAVDIDIGPEYDDAE